MQETNGCRRWLAGASLYVLGSCLTATLLGAALGTMGAAASGLTRGSALNALGIPSSGGAPVAVLAIAYAVSDLGVIPMPRPVFMPAVPVTWWRRWRPYRASLLYGASLGLGVMTRVPFGAFYVLCAVSVLRGSILYAALLMGTYGIIRGFMVMPLSLAVGLQREGMEAWLPHALLDLRRAQGVVAAFLMAFGIEIVVAGLLPR